MKQPKQYVYKSRRKKGGLFLKGCFYGIIIAAVIMVIAINALEAIFIRVDASNLLNSKNSLPVGLQEENLPAALKRLNSRNAVLMELNSNREVIFDLSGNSRIYPASLTKIMTAIIVIENNQDYNSLLTLSQQPYDQAITQGLATAGFVPGEIASVKDLLYGMMLPSGAECAIGLAEFTAGSEGEFVGLMNQKAIELGLDNTKFTNAAGQHDPGQYTTAYDMAVLLDYALKNEMFYEIFTSPSYYVGSTNKHPDGMAFHSSMFSKAKEWYSGFTLLGGKTGYTSEAGQCLASLAGIGGGEYILVTAGAKVISNNFESKHVEDAVKVFSALE
ncbi:MAG: D-alanyl-D-alanine carboxypeptidase [Clostridiales bacterium]|jgi:D-alanyl-D-alanine carboxypeptidase (penicillin-binding protein 5/6)|nr:D-alanyl-D-alanine carboxypeptidase [Clostridiales bacterium]